MASIWEQVKLDLHKERKTWFCHFDPNGMLYHTEQCGYTADHFLSDGLLMMKGTAILRVSNIPDQDIDEGWALAS